MKASELRIGNTVTINGGNDYNAPHIHNVDAIDISIASDDKRFSPIPLTEEWLLMFGFIKSNDMDSWYRMGILNEWTVLFINPKHKMAEISISKHGCVLKFNGMVHSLQNLYFALTGEELAINLQAPTK